MVDLSIDENNIKIGKLVDLSIDENNVKIGKLVDSGAESLRARIDSLEQKLDISIAENQKEHSAIIQKLDQIKKMEFEDTMAIVEDFEKLKKRVKKLETKVA